MDSLALVRKAKEEALAGKLLDRDTIIALLDIDPWSKAGEYLGQAAREVAAAVCKNRAYLWAAIGLDFRACPMSCNFCSLGEHWGLVGEEREFSETDIVRAVEEYVRDGVRWIVLRTTQFYDLEKLIELVPRIRETVPGSYQLVLNVGEFDAAVAARMARAGVEYVYHTVRLREGIDTKFNPVERMATLRAVNSSPLQLVYLVEPVGVEHTNEEIANAFLTAMQFGAVVTGAMARVPVTGTPLGRLPVVAPERLAQIAAVTRLAAGYRAPDICVHPASKLALQWGANVTVVEKGAIPREAGCHTGSCWQGFDAATAKEWFAACGYRVYREGIKG